MAVARPHRAAEWLAIGPREERLLREALVVHAVAGIDLDARVDHRERLEAARVELLQHRARLREALRVPGEAAVPIHVMDVEVEHVAGYAALALMFVELAVLR